MRGSKTVFVAIGLVLATEAFEPGAFAQDVPPVVVPFETANTQIFGDRFDRSIRGFFEFETQGVFGFFSSFQGQTTNQRTNERFARFQDEASASIDTIPIPSGAVSVAYTYDSALETFVRWQRPLAPTLSTNARTDGKGTLTIGTAYSRLDYTSFDGDDRDAIVLPSEPIEAFGPDVVDVLLFQFEFQQSVYSISLQYGLLENLDVGLLIPVIDQSFEGFLIDRFVTRNADGSFTRYDGGGNALPPTDEVDRDFFDVTRGEVPLTGFSYEDERFGIGDLILRSKMFFGSGGPADFGGALNVSLPTGDEDDLMGVGAVRVDPRFIVSGGTSRFSMHANLGMHVDFDEGDRNRVDYSLGGEVAVLEWLTLLVDHVGRIEIQGGDGVEKYDIVPGIKVNPYESVVLGFNAIVPLNDEGLRTDFTPNATAEISFTF